MDCKICYEKFDSDNLKPIICIPCGHSFCNKCVVQLKDCPICRAFITDKKPNFSLLEILEEKLKKPKSNKEALELKNAGISLNEEKRYYDALMKFEEALDVCENEYPEKYSLLW